MFRRGAAPAAARGAAGHPIEPWAPAGDGVSRKDRDAVIAYALAAEFGLTGELPQ